MIRIRGKCAFESLRKANCASGNLDEHLTKASPGSKFKAFYTIRH
jgi:hypothetical protein